LDHCQVLANGVDHHVARIGFGPLFLLLRG
jgi:hypothetical protein